MLANDISRTRALPHIRAAIAVAAISAALLLFLPACHHHGYAPVPISQRAGISTPWYIDPAAPASAPDGVFDRTEVLIAFHRSAAHTQLIESMIRQRDAARASGDLARVRELELQGEAMQDYAHRQLAGRAPLDNIAAALHDDLPAIAHAAGVGRIIERGGETSGKPAIDVTAALIERLPPSITKE